MPRRAAFKKLEDRKFELTSVCDPMLLQKTGMDSEFDLIFQTVGWEDFWDITEPGSRLLTLEFLCTLKATETGVEFRLFGKEFSPSWKELSLLLGFHGRCSTDLDTVLQDFDRTKFWKEISGKSDFEYPRTNDIHNPTLRFMHRWLGMTLFPRNDTSTFRIDELKLLYAMIKRKKVSPAKIMIYQWMDVFTRTGSIEYFFSHSYC